VGTLNNVPLSFDDEEGSNLTRQRKVLSSTEWPRIASDNAIMVVVSARPMEVTARIGNTELVLWLEQEYCYDRWDAYQLLTQAGGLYVGNMADTTYSLVASVDKKYVQRRS
jgi:amidase